MNSILIPYHHRIDLLLPLLKNLKDFPVLVVDDGPTVGDWDHWKSQNPKVECVRAKGSSGFTKVVNCGLDYLERRGVQSVLILNDDAWIEPISVQAIFDNMAPNKIISPVIEVEKSSFFGAYVSRIGRVKLQLDPSKPINALLGACLCIPSNLRMDSQFIHGFEDIALTHWAFNQGYKLTVLYEHRCYHLHGGTLNPLSAKGLKYSIYGHLQLYDSLPRVPLVWASYVALLLKEGGDENPRIDLLNSINQGVSDWFWRAIAVRMASFKLGSSKAR